MFLRRLLPAAVLIGCCAVAAGVRAEELAVEGETVELALILPVLSGTELGSLVVADAPLPGESRVVRASDIKALLKAHGADARGLALPRSVKLVRRARSVKEGELTERVREALASQIFPCQVASLSSLPSVSLAAGEYEVITQTSARRDSGRAPLSITLKQGERSQRISAQLEVSCPAPVVHPGANVRLVAVSGAVRVSAPAVAHQPGRVGDEIRVTNQVTKRQMRARVRDAQTVEVVQ
jgi:Chaperone for flagella basal body P-ring formation